MAVFAGIGDEVSIDLQQDKQRTTSRWQQAMIDDGFVTPQVVCKIGVVRTSPISQHLHHFYLNRKRHGHAPVTFAVAGLFFLLLQPARFRAAVGTQMLNAAAWVESRPVEGGQSAGSETCAFLPASSLWNAGGIFRGCGRAALIRGHGQGSSLAARQCGRSIVFTTDTDVPGTLQIALRQQPTYLSIISCLARLGGRLPCHCSFWATNYNQRQYSSGQRDIALLAISRAP